MHLKNALGLLTQSIQDHLPNTQPLPTRRKEATGAWKDHMLTILTWKCITGYSRVFRFLPNHPVGVPSPEEL